MAEADTLDYLGRPAAISIAEKPALPVGALPAPTAGPSAPSGTGVMATGAGTGPGASGASGPFISGDASSVVTTPTGEPGIPGQPGGTQAVQIARRLGESNPSLASILLGAGEAGGKVLDLLKKLGLTGADAATVSPLLEGGGNDFSLGGQSPDSALAPSDFTLDAGSVDAILPELLQLRGLFENADEPLPASFFNLFSQGGESVLPPSDFSLGTDTSVTAPDVSAPDVSASEADMSGLQGGDAIGAAVSALAKFGGMFADDPELKAALMIASTVGSAFANPFMAAWNAPQAAYAIDRLLQGTEQIERRMQRNMDAGELQSQIFGPLSKAKTKEEFVAALGSPVGDVRAGDALASVLRNNLSGTYYTDTAHNWLPDVSLIPMYQLLLELGYSGEAEPTKRDVGGVGEIIAGAGQRLIPASAYERGGPFYAGDVSDEGGQRTNVGNWGLLPAGTNARSLNDPAARGALGWDSILRMIAGTTDAPTTVSPPLISQGGVRNTSDEGGGFVDPATGAPVPLQTGLDPAYLDALRAFSPETADQIQRANQAALDDYYLQQQGGNG